MPRHAIVFDETDIIFRSDVQRIIETVAESGIKCEWVFNLPDGHITRRADDFLNLYLNFGKVLGIRDAGGEAAMMVVCDTEADMVKLRLML